MQNKASVSVAPNSNASTIPSDFDELESLNSQTEDVLSLLNNEAKDHAGLIFQKTILVQLSRVLRVVGDSLISYAKIIDTYEDVHSIPKEALWTPPTFSTSQDLASSLLGFPPSILDTAHFYPLTNVNLLQIAYAQHQLQENISKKILTKSVSRPIKKAPLRKMKSSSSDIAMETSASGIGSSGPSALKNEIHPDPEDEEMNEIFDSFDFDSFMEDLKQNDRNIAGPSTSTSSTSQRGVNFSLKKVIKKEEITSGHKEPKDEKMDEASLPAPTSTHVDLKKFLCPI